MPIISRNDILFKNVLSVDGNFVGKVRDLALDTRAVPPACSALVLEGTAEAPKRIVPWGRIRTIGRDAVMIEGLSSAIEAGSTTDQTRAPEMRLIDKPVVREDGQSVGRIGGFRFDSETGALVAIEVAGNGFAGWLAQLNFGWTREIPVGEIKSVGADAVVLASGMGESVPTSPAAT